MSFAVHAKAAREAAFATFGQPVVIDPDGAALARTALISAASVTESMGAIQIAQNGRFFRFRAEEAPPRGAVIAVLLEASGGELDRRRVQGDPVFVDARRLTVEIDTAPL